MGAQPGAGQQHRGPPREAGEDGGGGQAANQFDQAGPYEVHRDGKRRPGHAQIEIAGHGQVAGKRRVFQMPNSGWAHAGLRQPVIQPGGGTIADIGAQRLVDGAEHLEQDKDGAGKGERAGQRVAVLDRAHQHTHGNGEGGREDAAQQQHRPPGSGQRRGGVEERGKELPFLARCEPREHADFSGNCSRANHGAPKKFPP